jgi:NADPH2:quinone reductase
MIMPRAVVFHRHGPAEVLRWESHDPGPPARGQVQLRHTAIGLNFIDIYDRTGLYPQALPAVPGREAAGIVVATGPGVRDFKPGQRVAYAHSQPGAYSEIRNIVANRLVRLPRDVRDEQAAALMLKGLTVECLVRRVHRLQSGERVLVHAAAGGVGSLLCQWARALGAHVIGVVGNESKVELARRHGCRHVLIAGRDDIPAAVRERTRGRMVDVVYDAVGKDTFTDSLDCLRPRGLMVSFGNASGPPPAIEPLELARRGSLFLTRPSLFHYLGTPTELRSAARALFSMVRSRKIKVHIGQRYPLRDAALAQTELTERRTTGATVLIP